MVTANSARVWRPARIGLDGLIGAVAAAVLLFGYGLLIEAMAVPMKVRAPWATTAESIAAPDFAISVVMCAFWATVLAIAFARWSTRPARLFVRTTVVLAALSLVAPIAAVDTPASTRIALVIGHVIAAAVVIPVLARSLRARTT